MSQSALPNSNIHQPPTTCSRPEQIVDFRKYILKTAPHGENTSKEFRRLETIGMGLLAPVLIKGQVKGLICFGPRLKEDEYEEDEDDFTLDDALEAEKVENGKEDS